MAAAEQLEEVGNRPRLARAHARRADLRAMLGIRRRQLAEDGLGRVGRRGVGEAQAGVQVRPLGPLDQADAVELARASSRGPLAARIALLSMSIRTRRRMSSAV